MKPATRIPGRAVRSKRTLIEKETKKKEGIIKGGFLTVVSITKFFVSQSDLKNRRKMNEMKQQIFTAIKSALDRS